VESGGRVEGSLGLTEGGMGGSGGGRRTVAIAYNRALRPQTPIPAPASIAHMASSSSTQSKGKQKAMEEEPSTSQCILFIQFFVHY
jgi:hypothetical protein